MFEGIQVSGEASNELQNGDTGSDYSRDQQPMQITWKIAITVYLYLISISDEIDSNTIHAHIL